MGVCAGLGRHTGIDPVVFRVGFAVLLLGSGIGLFLYLAAFLLMKEPNGKPGIIEQWTRRDFDAEAVMALLTAVLAFGLAINLATVWLDTGTLVVAVFLAVALLAAHSSGVDLLGLARSMPERLSRRRGAEPAAAFYRSTEQAPPVRAPEPAPPTTAVPRLQEPAAANPMTPVSERTPVRDETPVSEKTSYEAPDNAPDSAPDEVPEEEAHTQVRDLREAAESVRDAAIRSRHAQQQEEEQRQVSAEAMTAQHAVPPYQKPSYRPSPPTAVDYASYGEPYAPNGPYQPLDPAKRPGYSPYDPVLYGAPVPKRERRPRSFIGAITILLAIIIGGIVVAVQARSAAGVSPTIVGGAMLITIGAGLLVAAWWGRGAGLVAAGTAVALIVGVGLMLGGVPRNIGPSDWAPTSVAEAARLYDVGVGDGRLDLSELKLPPGTEVTFNAAVSAGELVVIVPSTAKVEVHATNKIGDIVLDQTLKGGVDVRLDKVLQPEVEPKGKVSTIVLNLKGGVGDMEVRRAA